MIIGGYLAPWESEELLALTRKNMDDLSINFIHAGNDVVIDYVAFPNEVETFAKRVHAKVKDIQIVYVVL